MVQTYVNWIILLSFMLIAEAQDPKVLTTIGEIIGRKVTKPLEEMKKLQKEVIYREVHEYLGVPFAQPPTGDLRFKKPAELKSLKSPFYAQNHGAVCPQNAVIFNISSRESSEDCLFLNIYVPVRPADRPSGHAVMIWIHGGGFTEGAGKVYDGGNMALSGNIIVVTINYRLGMFGFLSTDDENAPGNFGLWDQHLAFKWVNAHIESFGGDNERVTIAGESAGAMSVTQHGLFPENQGLFQRIIAQSGSITIPLRDFEQPLFDNTLLVAKMLNCNTEKSDFIMVCLRNASTETILRAFFQLSYRVNFGPIIDGDLIKVNPQTIAKSAEELKEIEFFRSVDFLSGFNAYEGAFLWATVLSKGSIETIQPTRREMSTSLLPFMLNRIFKSDLNSGTMKVIEAQYTDWKNPYDSSSIRLQITKMLGDSNFGVPAIEMARLHIKSNESRPNNFMYHFRPKPSVVTLQTPSWIPGSNHMDELPFMFGMVDILGKVVGNEWETELASKMVAYWTNFVKSGNPNIPEQVTPNWPEYSLDNGDFLNLDKIMSNTSADRYFYAEEANFWLDVFQELVGTEEVEKCSQNNETSSAVYLYTNCLLTTMLVIILTSKELF